MSLRAFLAAACLLFPAGSACAEPAPVAMLFRNWSTKDGLPQDHIRDMVRTRDGFLWIATDAGVARFDGFEFKSFGLQEGLGSISVLSLLEARDGSLWLGTMGGGVSVLRGGKVEKTFTKADGLPSDSVSLLAEDADGHIWAADRVGFVRLEGNRFEPIVDAPEEGRPWLRALQPTGDGRMWASFPNGSLWSWMNGKWANEGKDGPKGVSAFCEDSQGRLWAGAQSRRLWCRDGSGWHSHAIPGEGNYISSLTASPDGTIWMAFFRSGLLGFRDGAFIQPTTKGEPFFDLAESVMMAEGQLWMGSSAQGLYALTPSQTEVALIGGNQANRSANFVGALLETSPGNFLVGSQGAGFYRWWDGESSPAAELSAADPYLFVNAMQKAGDGTIWAGTGKGLFQIKGDGSAASATVMPYDVWDLCRDPAGGLWAGMGAGSLFRCMDGTSKEVPYGSNRVPIKGMATGPDGALWVGTRGNGLFRKSGNDWKRFGLQDGLRSEVVRVVRVARDGTVWVGTMGGGLSVNKGDRFISVTTADGLPDNIISQITDDDEGRLWLGTNRGLAILDGREVANIKAGKTGRLYPRVIDRFDGLLSEEFTIVPPVKASDGRFAFATTRGFALLNPADFHRDESVPPVALEQVLADGRALDHKGNKIELPPGVKRLEFRFTGLHLAAPNRLHFRNRLAGLEEGWGIPGVLRTAEYRNLPPGDYRFEVSASTGNGLWSDEPAFIDITVRPQFWETWWFRSMALLLAVAAVALIARRRERARAQVRIRKLEREQAVDAERARIARDLHDDVGATLTQVALLSQLVTRRPESAGDHAREIFDTAKDLTRSLDEIVWAVNPANDTLESFVLFLVTYVQKYSNTAGLRNRIEVAEPLSDGLLAAPVRHHLYLATKEVLHNIVKHAGASEIRLRLTSKDKGLQVDIEDNGRGFDPSSTGKIPGADGLLNLQQRLEQVGGKCIRNSSPGKGSSVALWVPLES